MGYESERAAIETRWRDQWGSRTPTHYEGTPFEPPRNGSWARITIRNGDAMQLERGGPGDPSVFRHSGVVIINLFAPLGKGSSAVRQLADAACAVFRKWRTGTVPDILFAAPYPIAEPIQDDVWFRLTVNCPFRRDEAF